MIPGKGVFIKLKHGGLSMSGAWEFENLLMKKHGKFIAKSNDISTYINVGIRFNYLGKVEVETPFCRSEMKKFSMNLGKSGINKVFLSR